MSSKQLFLSKQKTNATKTSITSIQSQKLLQTMLTMSFGCLAFLRGLFPDENFVDQRFVPEKVQKDYNKQNNQYAGSIKIKTLVRGKSSDVDLLLGWLEDGVFQSIKLGYLKALCLGIFLEEENPTDLVETYVFSFNYDEADRVKLNISGPATTDEDDSISLLDSRKVAQQLIRRFIIVTQSLDPLPRKKFLSMRLLFNDKTDKSYQPELFRDASFDKPATIKLPMSVNWRRSSVGHLNTKHHNLDLKVFSRLDAGVGESDKPLVAVDPLSSEAYTENGVEAGTNHVESQTTHILGNFLDSPQDNIEPTQAVSGGAVSRLSCECKLGCHPGTTAMKNCKLCKRVIHGVCYGNYGNRRIPACLTCVMGEQFDMESDACKDLMMLRRCYRSVLRNHYIPQTISSFWESLMIPSQITSETIERVKFCLTVLFLDGVLSISPHIQRGPSAPDSTNKHRRTISSIVNIDCRGIFTADGKELPVNQKSHLQFEVSSSWPHSCYTDSVPTSKEQVNDWIQQIVDLRKKYSTLVSDSCDIQSLTIATDDRNGAGLLVKKRGYEELTDLSGSGENSKLQVANTPYELDTPRKIRKISISKKTLRSNW